METRPRERVLSKHEEIADFPDHLLDRLRGVPGYALRVGDVRVIVDWDREADVPSVVEVLERKHDYRGLAGLHEVWGTRRA